MKPEGRDVQESEYKLGYVVGINTSDSFRFVIPEDANLKKWEYVYIDLQDRKILGRIEGIQSKSDLLNEGLDYESVSKYVSTHLEYSTSVCIAKTLGLVEGDRIELSRELIKPGTPVYRAPSDLLERVFRTSDEEALDIGYLADRPDVRVSVNINGMRRHVAIIAQTGAGKSHTAGVLMEELLKKGASIVVLDPHADYVLMRRDRSGKHYQNDIKIFRTPLSTGRYDTSQNGVVDQFTLKFSDLDADDLSQIMGIKESWVSLRKAVENALSKMHGRKDFQEFMNTVENLDPEDYKKLAGRLRFLSKVKSIFSERTTDMTDYLSPGLMSVLDLSGLDQFLANYFSLRVLTAMMEAKMSGQYKYPIFVFIEEAHNFIPPKSQTEIAQIIRKIASEGRKFGLFLVIITQRPGKIDQDILSQCNSEIILRVTNPLDQSAIIESGESISESILQDLPSLNIGEAILVGQFVKMPVNVKIRQRESMEGGGDVDLVPLLKEALGEREKKKSAQEDLKRVSRILGD